MRTFTNGVRDQAEGRIRALVDGISAAHGAKVSPPITAITNQQSMIRRRPLLRGNCQGVVRWAMVLTDFPASMGAEDFAMLMKSWPRPSSGRRASNPDSPHNFGLHHPKYDFNDAIIPSIIRYFGTTSNGAAAMTPDSLDKRLALIEERLSALESRARETPAPTPPR